jgi:cell division septation protein DedD
MRKLLLTTAIVLLTSSAFAGGSRGLSVPQPTEPQKPFRQAEVTILPAPGEQPAATSTQAVPQTMEDKLKAAGELKADGTPATPPVATPAPVQPAPAPVQAQPAPAPAQTQTTTVQAQPAQKPAKKRVVRKRESDERKARRIAARFGIYW